MIGSIRARYQRLSPRRRQYVLTLLAVVLIFAAIGIWMAWMLITGLLMGKSAAAEAGQAAKSGDNQKLQSAVADMNTAAERINTVSSSPPVWVAAHIPYFGRSVRDLQQFSDAGVSATKAAQQVAPAYQANIYADQTINLQTVDAVLKALPTATDNLNAATNSLEQVQGDGIGGSAIMKYRDSALAGMATLDVAAAQLSNNRPAVLDALGANGPKSYLVPLLNNAQLRASGGAPLSAAVITVNKGKITIPFNGYINGKAYKGHPSVSYTSASPVACQPKPAECASVPLYGAPPAGLSFVNSNANPDWRLSGDDLHRAWNASQDRKVDGVIALDTQAIESLLEITGPVETTQYGTVSADNFTDLVLKSAYDNFADDQKERQDVNDEIGQAVIGKLLNGNVATLSEMATMLVQDAQGRNVQMYFANPVLEKAAVTLGLGGVIQAGEQEDTVAVYSRNRNSSKVDVYSERDLDVNVDVSEDGSAKVKQTLRVRNGATGHGNSSDDIGYQTNLSANDWFFVLPLGATNPKLQTPAGYDKVSIHPDGLGRQVLATTGNIPAGDTVELVAEYSLPAGTFSVPDGVEYQTALNPQPLQNPVNLNLNVQMPGGDCTSSSNWNGSSYTGPLDSTGELWVRCNN